MRIGHWDARFGFSGDMALGSLLDAGARREVVNAALGALGVPGLRVEAQRAVRCGLDCARAVVRWEGDGLGKTADEAGGHPQPRAAHRGHGHGHGHDHGHGDGHGHDHGHAHAGSDDTDNGEQPTHVHPHPPQGREEGQPQVAGRRHAGHAHVHRAYREIRELLARAPLAPGVRTRAEAIFARLAEAEGRIHGCPPSDVHFHEVGGEDALGDIVGVAAALEDLAISEVTVSALPAGGGTVSAAHGLLPVPAPAVALLLEGFDFHPGPVEAELVTPTGAAILAATARPAQTWPSFRLEGSGWGAGKRDFPGHPNACRFVWGQVLAGEGLESETLVELETNIDDQSPEAVGHLYERLFAAGALDVATSPLWMKKQRPGVRVWALVRPADARRAARCLFEESSALGLRVREVRRWSLPRTTETVSTRYGPVRVKVARLDGRIVNAAPEYEDCRAAAAEHRVPLKAVLAAAVAAWEARVQAAGGE